MLDMMERELLKLKDVEYCEIYQNMSHIPNNNNCEYRWSIKVFVDGGNSKDIAKIIWQYKPIGIVTCGEEFEIVDGYGVRFSRINFVDNNNV